jgi:hypothetical protein
VPPALGAALLLLLIAGLLGFGGYTLSDNAAALVKDLPRAARLLQERLKQNDTARAPIERVQDAADDALQGPAARAGRGVDTKPSAPPPFDVREYLWWGTKNLVAAGTQIVIHRVLSGLFSPRLRRSVQTQAVEDRQPLVRA